MIFGCSYMFLGWPCIKYVRNWWWWGVGWGGGGMGGVIQNAYVQLRIRGRGFHNF